jgi:hypothetical protein
VSKVKMKLMMENWRNFVSETGRQEHMNSQVLDQVRSALGLRDLEDIPDEEYEGSPEEEFNDLIHIDDPQMLQNLKQYLQSKGTSLEDIGI